MRETAKSLIGTSDAVRVLREDIDEAASSDARVLITGDTGTGKEVVAELVHASSRRSRRKLIALNCAAIPDSLLESELFGHERGSFTGAETHRDGVLNAADGGTVFLDEVGEMSPRMQSLLLRFLDNGEMQRVGGGHTTRADVRVIAATNRDLTSSVAANVFRLDLFYRLNVLHLRTTALRDRPEDVPFLFAHFLEAHSAEAGSPLPILTPEALTALAEHDWPGNVRQVRNVAQRLVVKWAGLRVESRHLLAELSSTVAGTAQRSADLSPDMAHMDDVYNRLSEGGESFWTAVHGPFMAHDLTRDEVRILVRRGLQNTGGDYKSLLSLFNVPAGDYRRLMMFLQKHECHATGHRPGRRGRVGDRAPHQSESSVFAP
jgi:DNA-binding NtrC family response regulator